jgi:glutamate synthase domain-containing protein 2
MPLAHWLASRFYFFAACVLGLLCSMVAMPWYPWLSVVAAILGVLVLVGILDLTQSKQSIRRNYPILAHLRFLLETIRPEIRQYFLESDTEKTPFSRAQRSLVYQRSKNVIDKRPMGTQLDVYGDDYEWINHSMVPTAKQDPNFRTVVGKTTCAQPYSASVFNISGMSFGALSAAAVRALNQGAKLGGFAHDTGEGGVSAYHREFEGDIIWQIGSGYFGCRTPEGHFDAERFSREAQRPQVRMIELKISQGAKPGHGGVLPGPKVTVEIAHARGVPIGVDCVSPSSHSAFSTPIEMLQFIARLRELSGGKPVGFKYCLGHPWEFFAVCKAMLETGITPDFIVVDGAEGGTGAAPVEFTDHVGTPLQEGLLLTHNTLVGLNLRSKVKIGASGKIITAFDIARTLALGADWCNSARGFMFALGCIQSQTCHTGACPTGVTTQDPLRQRALVVPDKATRVANFHRNTLMALAELISAAGLTHPSQLRPFHIVRRVSVNEVRLVSNLIRFVQPGELLKGSTEHDVYKYFWPMARADSFAPGHAGEVVHSMAR